MTVSRPVVLFAVCAAFLPGCGKQKLDGVYFDSSNRAVRYELSEGGEWSAESKLETPAGVFPHGAGRRIAGSFSRSGDLLELVCFLAERQDPVSGEYRPDDADPSRYNHLLLVKDGALVAVGPNGEEEAIFATDLNPFGARKLVREHPQQ